MKTKVKVTKIQAKAIMKIKASFTKPFYPMDIVDAGIGIGTITQLQKKELIIRNECYMCIVNEPLLEKVINWNKQLFESVKDDYSIKVTKEEAIAINKLESNSLLSECFSIKDAIHIGLDINVICSLENKGVITKNNGVYNANIKVCSDTYNAQHELFENAWL